jgi:hypothetical protein
MFGSFSKESLEKFQEMQGLTSNQDFSEGLFDFTRCQKPDGSTFGTDGQCKPPNRPYHQNKGNVAEDIKQAHRRRVYLAKKGLDDLFKGDIKEII